MGQDHAPRVLALPRDIVDFKRVLFLDRALDEQQLFRELALAAPRAAVHENIPRDRAVIPLFLDRRAEFCDRRLQNGVGKFALHRLHRLDRPPVFLARHKPLGQFIGVRNVYPAARTARNVDGDSRNRHFLDVAVHRACGDAVFSRKLVCVHAPSGQQVEQHSDHDFKFHKVPQKNILKNFSIYDNICQV